MDLAEFLLVRIAEDERSNPERAAILRTTMARVQDIASRTGVDAELLSTLLILARPYADHPDYRPEWRP